MPPREKDWTNILFLGLSPVIGILGTLLYALRYGVAWWEPVLFFTLFMTVGLSVGSGYHRYFSHRTYDAHPAVESVLLFFGAFALQNSVLQWARDHREHHRFVDRDWDPYNIKRGVLWAHILWIFYKEGPGKNFEGVPDLTSNPRVMWQHRHAAFIGIVFGLGIPTLVGAMFGHPLGGLLWGGFLRIVLIHHTTFFVNSLAHLWGSRPYSTENSARDNWFLAFFTHGEGYHNFHHKFPADFRNGVRWYQWDPNKWFIRALRLVGLAKNLRATPPPLMERARLQVAEAAVPGRLAVLGGEIAEAWEAQIQQARDAMEESLRLWREEYVRYRELKAERSRGKRPSSDVLKRMKRSVRDYEKRFRQLRLQWLAVLEGLSSVPEGA